MVVKGACASSGAYAKWTDAYLVAALGGHAVRSSRVGRLRRCL
jgi:hypothetical protein